MPFSPRPLPVGRGSAESTARSGGDGGVLRAPARAPGLRPVPGSAPPAPSGCRGAATLPAPRVLAPLPVASPAPSGCRAAAPPSALPALPRPLLRALLHCSAAIGGCAMRARRPSAELPPCYRCGGSISMRAGRVGSAAVPFIPAPASGPGRACVGRAGLSARRRARSPPVGAAPRLPAPVPKCRPRCAGVGWPVVGGPCPSSLPPSASFARPCVGWAGLRPLRSAPGRCCGTRRAPPPRPLRRLRGGLLRPPWRSGRAAARPACSLCATGGLGIRCGGTGNPKGSQWVHSRGHKTPLWAVCKGAPHNRKKQLDNLFRLCYGDGAGGTETC